MAAEFVEFVISVPIVVVLPILVVVLVLFPVVVLTVIVPIVSVILVGRVAIGLIIVTIRSSGVVLVAIVVESLRVAL